MEKISQAEANYTPLGESVATQCQKCRMFVSPNGCTLVEGKINPLGHCSYFEPAKRAKPAVAPAATATGPGLQRPA